MIECSWDILKQYKKLINQILIGEKPNTELTKRIQLNLKKLELSEESNTQVLQGIEEILSKLKDKINAKESSELQTLLDQTWQELEVLFDFVP